MDPQSENSERAVLIPILKILLAYELEEKQIWDDGAYGTNLTSS